MNELQPIPVPKRYTMEGNTEDYSLQGETTSTDQNTVQLDDMLDTDIDMRALYEKAAEARPKPYSATVDTTESTDDYSTVGTLMGKLGASVLSTYQGLENIATKVAAVDKESNTALKGVLSDMVTGNWSNIPHRLNLDPDKIEKTAEQYHKSLQVAKGVNKQLVSLGLPPVVPSIDDTLKYWKTRTEVIENGSDLALKAASVTGDVAGFMATWELGITKALPQLKALTEATGVAKDINYAKAINAGKTAEQATVISSAKTLGQYGVKDTLALNAGQGAVAGVQNYGETNTASSAVTQAIVATTFGTALMGVAKGANGAITHWHPFSSEGTKLIKGFERNALETTFRGKALALEQAKQEFGSRSYYGSWDRLPEMDKALFLATKSESGIGRITEAMADPTVFDAVMNSLRNMDKASKEILGNIKDVTKLIESGTKMIDDGTIVQPHSTTYLQDVLTKAGFIKGTGATAKDDIYGIEWEAVKKILNNSSDGDITALINSLHYASNEAKTSLKTGLQGVRDSLPPTPEKYDLESLRNAINLRLSAKRAGKSLDEVLNGVPNTNLQIGGTDIRNRQLLPDWESIEDSILASGAGITKNNEGKVIAISLTPENIFNAYVDLQNKVKVGGDAYDAVKGKQHAEVVLDLLDDMTDGVHFKQVIKNAVQAQAVKRRIVEDFGLGKLMSNKANLTPIEIRQGLESMANRMADFDTEYRYMIESLGSKKVQVEVETALIKALAESRDVNLRKFGDTDTGRSSVQVLDALNKNISAIENFKPVTREGRVLQESLKSINSATDGIVRRMIGNRFERSIVSEFRVGISNALHRIVGSLQTDLHSINNLPYVANKLVNMSKNVDFEINTISGRSVLRHYEEKMNAGQLSFEGIPLSTGIEVGRMIDNLRKLKGLNELGDITKPYTPTPNTPPNAPTPPTAPTPTPAQGTPMPTPKPVTVPSAVAKSVLGTGKMQDSVILTNIDVKQLDDARTALLNKIMEDKGYLPPMTNGYTQEWIAYNNQLTALSKGKNNTMLLDPLGRPVLVLHTGDVKLAKSFKSKDIFSLIHPTAKSRPNASEMKKGVSEKGYKLTDILDVSSYEPILKDLNMPNLLDDMYVSFYRNANNSNTRGSHSRSENNSIIQINLASKGIGNAKDTHTFQQRILSTLQHEIVHAVQYKTGMLAKDSRGQLPHLASTYENTQLIKNHVDSQVRQVISKLPDEVGDKIFNLLNTIDRYSLSNGTMDDLAGLTPFVQTATGDTLMGVKDFKEGYALVDKAIQQFYKDKGYDGITLKSLTNMLETKSRQITRYRASGHEAQARFVQKLAEMKGLSTNDVDGALQDFIRENESYLDLLWAVTANDKDTMVLLNKYVANITNGGKPDVVPK